MEKKVVITINFGNEAMQTEHDMCEALRELARRISKNGLDKVSKVMDANGNAVGTVE
jgi:hypothetical protein